VRSLVRTIPRRAALAAVAGLLAGLVLLAIAAPRLADQHDAETLEAWLGSEARLAGELAGRDSAPTSSGWATASRTSASGPSKRYRQGGRVQRHAADERVGPKGATDF
jgi:hypothetical protein